MRGFVGELRFALRQLTKNPGYSGVVILTLALSIGANTAIFSVVDAIMLRPLPYPAPQRLGSLMKRTSGQANTGSPSNIDRESWIYLRDNIPAVTAAVASGSVGVNLEAAGRAQYVKGERVSAKYFDVLGVTPLLGRSFTAVEDTEGGPNVVVLSWNLWKNTFGSDPSIVGKPMRLKDVPYTIIGVLPPGMRTPSAADLWTPLHPETTAEGGGDNFDAILRLNEGATWEQVNVQLRAMQSLTLRMLANRYPNVEVHYYAAPLQQTLATGTRMPVMILMWAVGFVLLVACANLAGLALVRISRRENEIATRLALGATRWAILRQFWIESLILTVAGGAAALWLGKLTLELINRHMPDGLLPLGGVSLDGRVLLFSAILAMGASLFFGLLPAMSTSRIDVRAALASGSQRTSTSGATGARYVLIAGEVALTVVLLTVAGLLLRTLIYLRTMPPGFNPEHVVTAQASLDEARYNDRAAFLRLLNESIEAMQKIPGVSSAAVGLSIPYERALNDGVRVADGLETGSQNMANWVYVTPDYFTTLQMPLRSGRPFSSSDTATSGRVAIVNRAFASKYLGREESVGRHVVDEQDNLEIVGIVDNVIAPKAFTEGVDPIAAEPTVYVPATQVPVQALNLAHTWFQPNWIVRTQGNLAGITQQMQQAMAQADPDLPISGVRSISDVLSQTLLLQHVEAGLLAALAGLALLLSCVGIYGLVSNLVQQRTRELGIRIALGCSLKGAMFEISRAGMVSSAAGLVGGLLLSFVAVRMLRSQIFGVSAYDPITLVSASLLLGMVALVAALLPTLRIAQVDPAETLRAQ